MTSNFWQIFTKLLLMVLALTFLVSPASSAEEINLEFKVKAAYLVNFTLFVEWPGEIVSDSGSSIDICLYETDPFGLFIDDLLIAKQSQFRNKKVSIVRVQHDSDMTGCDVLFVPSSEMGNVTINNLKRDNLLLIGESPDFLALGGMINYFLNKEHVSFEINLKELKKSRLKISSKLLRLAKTQHK